MLQTKHLAKFFSPEQIQLMFAEILETRAYHNKATDILTEKYNWRYKKSNIIFSFSQIIDSCFMIVSIQKGNRKRTLHMRTDTRFDVMDKKMERFAATLSEAKDLENYFDYSIMFHWSHAKDFNFIYMDKDGVWFGTNESAIDFQPSDYPLLHPPERFLGDYRESIRVNPRLWNEDNDYGDYYGLSVGSLDESPTFGSE